MLKIAVSGIHYPLSMMTWFIRALQRREDVELITVGPYTEDWIPWNYGMRISRKYIHCPTIPLPQMMIGQRPSFNIIKGKVPEDIDLWLQIDAGWSFSDRPNAKVVAQIQTDSHVLRGQYSRYKQFNDISFCMQTPYMEAGEKFLPYAYDPTVHYPVNVGDSGYAGLEYDACLIGLLYDHRKSLINSLSQKGMNVYYNIGEVFDEYRERYGRSKVALNWSSMQDLPARVWEAFAMGVPLVTNRNMPDLHTFFVENDHFLGFDTVSEGVEKVEWVLNNLDKAFEMAEAARRKVEPHTWDNRITEILTTVKLI